MKTTVDDVLSFLEKRPEYKDEVKHMVKYEEENAPGNSPYTKREGVDIVWGYDDVGVHPSTMNVFTGSCVVNKIVDTNSTTRYALSNRDAVKEAIEKVEELTADAEVIHSFPDQDEISEDIFSDVVGFEDVKWLLKRGMSTDSITNFLLKGPPGSAKTVFLLCIRRLDNAVYLFGPDITGAGFNEMMFNKKPMYICIDEIDDMDKSEQESLSSYTETGIVKETKYGKTRELRINSKTFAACNTTTSIKSNIKDRFTILEFEEYTKEEFMNVCENILPREGVSEDDAVTIAKQLYRKKNTTDVRQAIQVARLSRDDPEKIIDVLDNYSPDAGVF